MSGFDYKKVNVEQPHMPEILYNKRSDNHTNFEVNTPEVESIDLDNNLEHRNNEFKTELVLEHSDEYISENIVDRGYFMGLKGDYEKLIDIFGGQRDEHGLYTEDKECDNYSRGYAIYLQTGKVVSFGEMTEDADGMHPVKLEPEAKSRTEQARLAYKMIKEKGIPCIIHVNSSHIGSGMGHWMCVVGYKKGVTEENITIGDLIVIDSSAQEEGPITAKVRPLSEDSYYCIEGFERCEYMPGYQIYYYTEME